MIFSFYFLFSFRETITDFLNYYMKPVEPMIPENVRNSPVFSSREQLALCFSFLQELELN